jgi:phosphoribosyl-dephospho-CoA transferase
MPDIFRRHNLIFVDTDRLENLSSKIAYIWFAAGYPGIVRRPCVTRDNKLCLGIPLPPEQGKLRISSEVPESAVISVESPPKLEDCLSSAPASYQESLNSLHDKLNIAGISANIIGSLGWEKITGLSYLTDKSDLDLLFIVNSKSEFSKINDILSEWHPNAKGKYDIEIMLSNGNGFLWKEYRQSSGNMLVKGNSQVFTASLEQLFA